MRREPPASREDGRSWNEGDGGEAVFYSSFYSSVLSRFSSQLTSVAIASLHVHLRLLVHSLINVVEELWESAESGGWRASSPPRSDWPPPTEETNGYLRVRCNGGLNQQRSAICNAVLAARIMNATLVLPELDANSFWHDDRLSGKIVDYYSQISSKLISSRNVKGSGFQGIYDVEHFIQTLKYDVKIVGKIPDVHKNGKTKKIKGFQIRPRRDAPIDCESIVDKLRSQGHFMSIHLRFEMDTLAFAGEKAYLQRKRRALGKCPLTPEEVGLILRRAIRFDNSTRIYLAAGELFGGERFMKPFRTLFPRPDNHSSVDPFSEELSPNSQGINRISCGLHGLSHVRHFHANVRWTEQLRQQSLRPSPLPRSDRTGKVNPKKGGDN
ncbi:hypothetical protein Bca4012_008537 [Brassica carinata]